MLKRYQTKSMQKIWSEEEKFITWLKVEECYLKYWIKENKPDDEKIINLIGDKIKNIDINKFINKINNYEEKTNHDVIAFLHALKDELFEHAQFIHMGLTSSDIVDTSFALLLKKASHQINKRIEELIKTLHDLAYKYKGLLMLGRTHGQPSEPITLGLKFLGFMMEFKRNQSRLENAIKEISVGKLSGAVGTYGHTSPIIEKKVLDDLGLRVEEAATQVIPRDRHAIFFTTLAVLGGSIERLALEIRLLSHGEIGEINEPFLEDQKGSSAMPHKRNPILSENLCGLMRIVRGYALASLENQPLWHERDISHSSAERILAPDLTTLIDFALKRLIFILKNLTVNEDKILKNLKKEEHKLKSQNLLAALINKGLSRKEAYDLVQKSYHNDELNKEEFLIHLSKEELKEIINLPLEVKYEDLIFKKIS